MTQSDSPKVQVNTASLAYLKALFDYAQAHDIPVEKLLAGHALEIDDRDARLTEAECAGLFDRAAELLHDEALGLHVGEAIRPGHYGVLGYVAMNCGTLGEALSRLRFFSYNRWNLLGYHDRDHGWIMRYRIAKPNMFHVSPLIGMGGEYGSASVCPANSSGY